MQRARWWIGAVWLLSGCAVHSIQGEDTTLSAPSSSPASAPQEAPQAPIFTGRIREAFYQATPLASAQEAEAWLKPRQERLGESAAPLAALFARTDFAHYRLVIAGGYMPGLPRSYRVTADAIEVVAPRWCGGGPYPPSEVVVFLVPLAPEAVQQVIEGPECGNVGIP